VEVGLALRSMVAVPADKKRRMWWLCLRSSRALRRREHYIYKYIIYIIVICVYPNESVIHSLIVAWVNWRSVVLVLLQLQSDRRN
jgi:hypothetical protein